MKFDYENRAYAEFQNYLLVAPKRTIFRSHNQVRRYSELSNDAKKAQVYIKNIKMSGKIFCSDIFSLL